MNQYLPGDGLACDTDSAVRSVPDEVARRFGCHGPRGGPPATSVCEPLVECIGDSEAKTLQATCRCAGGSHGWTVGFLATV